MGATTTILQGDVLGRLAELPPASVHCVITSPPYWGLRRYIDDNAPEKRHEIGLEPTLDEWVARMVEVFGAVRRVLRDDGTLWLNLGDAYTSGGRDGHGPQSDKQQTHVGSLGMPRARQPAGLKPKDMLGMPWRVAFALQADGWWLRSDIIWQKPNPMPESTTDRPTKSHEHIFLLTKAARYFYDADAIREPHCDLAGPPSRFGNVQARPEGERPDGIARAQFATRAKRIEYNPLGRNARDVWTIATQAYPEAHFATYPEELVRRCLLAGTSARGVCPECGAPWVRVRGRTEHEDDSARGSRFDAGKTGARLGGDRTQRGQRFRKEPVGWTPTCPCNRASIPATVLDPFLGSGTTLAVALRYGRSGVGIELNPEYVKLAEARIAAARRKHGTPLFEDIDELELAPMPLTPPTES